MIAVIAAVESKRDTYPFCNKDCIYTSSVKESDELPAHLF